MRTLVSGNSAVADNADGDAIAFAGGILAEHDLVLTSSAVHENQVAASVPASSSALAYADGGGLEADGVVTIESSVIGANGVRASAASGTAIAQGGGIANTGQLTLRKTLVVGNSATANDATGAAQGGGIWNDTFGGPPPSLMVSDSAIVGNRLSGSRGVALAGGGLFTSFPVTLTRTSIVLNRPDQWHGC